MMHDHGQSDSPVVPTKSPNNAGRPAAEGMEGRGLAKGNLSQLNAPRAQDRVGASSALERVRQVAERDKQVRFTTLLHHIYNVDHLRAAYFALKRDAAPGIDGETWQHYGEALEENLRDLSGRLGRSRSSGRTSPRPMGGSGRWASPRWRTSSSSGRRSRC
jgi:hypothetical protein